MLLFISGLPDDMDNIDLKEMFELYGQVDSSKVIYDKFTKRSRGFGFIEMPNTEEANEVLNLFGKGVNIGRKKLMVKKAEANEQQNSGFNNRPQHRSNNFQQRSHQNNRSQNSNNDFQPRRRFN